MEFLVREATKQDYFIKRIELLFEKIRPSDNEYGEIEISEAWN